MELIRPATISDSEKIKDIASRAGYIDYISDNIERMLKDGGMYVYEYGNVKGFAQAGFRKICWISAIRVDPEYRRHGVAEKLIRKIEEEGKERKCRAYGALVAEDNIASRSMFRKLGYVEIEQYISFMCEPLNLTEIHDFDLRERNYLMDWEIWDKNEMIENFPDLKVMKDSKGNEYVKSSESYQMIKLVSKPDYSEGGAFLSINKRLLNDGIIKEMKDTDSWTFIYYGKDI